jgi:predicted ATPase
MFEKESMKYIRSLELEREKIASFSEYPFCLPAVKNLGTLNFHPNVTFIVGENGTGKSTILEAIAVACGFNPEGGTKNFNFASMESHSDLHRHIRLVRGIRMPKDGFFLRAESFYNLATNIEQLDQGGGGPRVIDSYGGRSLHKQSHGESFFAAFMNRFGGNGLYILDEPEAALSPSRQMAMISRIHQLVGMNSQFIIATHSPIIMAYPNADIFELREGFERVAYEDTDHYNVTKSFLNNTGKMLGILME